MENMRKERAVLVNELSLIHKRVVKITPQVIKRGTAFILKS